MSRIKRRRGDAIDSDEQKRRREAMRTCENCGAYVREDQDECPICGYPGGTSSAPFSLAVLVGVLIAVAMLFAVLMSL